MQTFSHRQSKTRPATIFYIFICTIKKKPSQTSFPSTLPPVPPLTKDIDDAKRPSFCATDIVSSKHGLYCVFASDYSLKTCSPSCLRKRNSSYPPLCFRTWKQSPALLLYDALLLTKNKNKKTYFSICRLLSDRGDQCSQQFLVFVALNTFFLDIS